MSLDINQKLLERLAAMEQRLEQATKPAAPEAPSFDFADPVGSLSKQGVDIDFLTKVLVARAMGDQAPPEFRAIVQMGPQLAQQRALEAKLTDLSRQVSDITNSATKQTAKQSFKALAADKTKYPALAKALEADPDFFNEAVEAHPGSVEEFASREEAKLVKLGYFVPPAASEEDADTTDDEQYDGVLVPRVAEGDDLGFDPNDESIVANGQSKQPESAVAARTVAPPPKRERAPMNAVPPMTQRPVGVFTQEDHTKLRDEVVRKYSRPER